MEEDDKGCPMIRMGVSGLIFLVPAYPGSPGQKAIKRLCVCYPGCPGKGAVRWVFFWISC